MKIREIVWAEEQTQLRTREEGYIKGLYSLSEDCIEKYSKGFYNIDKQLYNGITYG